MLLKVLHLHLKFYNKETKHNEYEKTTKKKVPAIISLAAKKSSELTSFISWTWSNSAVWNILLCESDSASRIATNCAALPSKYSFKYFSVVVRGQGSFKKNLVKT